MILYHKNSFDYAGFYLKSTIKKKEHEVVKNDVKNMNTDVWALIFLKN